MLYLLFIAVFHSYSLRRILYQIGSDVKYIAKRVIFASRHASVSRKKHKIRSLGDKYDGTSATWLIGCTTAIHCKVTLYNISISMLNLSLKWRGCIRRWEHENAHDTCDAFKRRSTSTRTNTSGGAIASHHGKNSHRMIDTRWIYHQGMRR